MPCNFIIELGHIVPAFNSGSQRALTVFVCKAFVMQIGEIAEKPPLLLKVVVIHIATRSESCVGSWCKLIYLGRSFFVKSLKELELKKKVVFLSSINLLLYEIWNYNRKVKQERGRKMVFCFQNCSDQLWEKNVLLIKKNFWNLRLKAKNLQNFLDHMSSERSEQFLKQNAFLTCSWRFLRSNILEQLDFKLEKIIGI